MKLPEFLQRLSPRQRQIMGGAILSLGAVCVIWLASTPQPVPTVLPGDDVVRARVNGAPVSEYDVRLGIETTLGDLGLRSLPAEAHENMLESVIHQRAIAQAAENDLEPEELAAVERRAQAFREQLLVKLYLAKHAPVKAPDEAEVRSYYEAHPERFGARKTRVFELLATERGVTPAERKSLEQQLMAATGQASWSEAGAELRRAGQPVVYRRERLSVGVLEQEISTLVQELPLHEVSPLTYVRGRAYVVRAVGEDEQPARPLDDVRADIVRALRPVQYRKSLDRITDQVMRDAKVERISASQAASQSASRSSVAERGPEERR